MAKLTVMQVRNAKPGIGPDGKPRKRVLVDGAGLLLVVAPTGARNWVLRVKDGKKRRDIGLGAADVDGAGRSAFAGTDKRHENSPLMLRRLLTLAEAREKAAALRKLTKAGADPVAERDRERRDTPTFATAVKEAHEALKSGWSDRTAKAFLASLEEHAVPKLGSMKVDVIGGSDLIAALAPIWQSKPVMARKVRARTLQVLAFAKARGWRLDALPDARELRSGGLSSQPAGKHFKAMPFADCPVFFTSQWEMELTASRAAMLFALLTGNRSGSVRAAKWEQIDFEAREWRCPAESMKSKRAHDVALSDAAIALLKRFQPDADLRSGLIFPGQRGKSLSDMSLTKALRTAGRSETVHGWRASFRTWAGEVMPHIPWNVAELAIAHTVGSSTEKAYNHGNYRVMRRALFDGWGAHIAPSLSGLAGNVAQFRKTEAG